MSIQLVTQVWPIYLPQGQKIVLLCLANHANDMGECWPTVRGVSLFCGMSERSVQQHLKALEDAGHIVRATRSGDVTHYSLRMKEGK